MASTRLGFFDLGDAQHIADPHEEERRRREALALDRQRLEQQYAIQQQQLNQQRSSQAAAGRRSMGGGGGGGGPGGMDPNAWRSQVETIKGQNRREEIAALSRAGGVVTDAMRFNTGHASDMQGAELDSLNQRAQTQFVDSANARGGQARLLQGDHAAQAMAQLTQQNEWGVANQGVANQHELAKATHLSGLRIEEGVQGTAQKLGYDQERDPVEIARADALARNARLLQGVSEGGQTERAGIQSGDNRYMTDANKSINQATNLASVQVAGIGADATRDVADSRLQGVKDTNTAQVAQTMRRVQGQLEAARIGAKASGTIAKYQHLTMLKVEKLKEAGRGTRHEGDLGQLAKHQEAVLAYQIKAGEAKQAMIEAKADWSSRRGDEDAKQRYEMAKAGLKEATRAAKAKESLLRSQLTAKESQMTREASVLKDGLDEAKLKEAQNELLKIWPSQTELFDAGKEKNLQTIWKSSPGAEKSAMKSAVLSSLEDLEQKYMAQQWSETTEQKDAQARGHDRRGAIMGGFDQIQEGIDGMLNTDFSFESKLEKVRSALKRVKGWNVRDSLTPSPTTAEKKNKRIGGAYDHAMDQFMEQEVLAGRAKPPKGYKGRLPGQKAHAPGEQARIEMKQMKAWKAAADKKAAAKKAAAKKKKARELDRKRLGGK